MIYFYGAVAGVLLSVSLHFIIKDAVAAGVKSALTSEDVEFLLSNVVSRGIELDRQNTEDAEEVL